MIQKVIKYKALELTIREDGIIFQGDELLKIIQDEECLKVLINKEYHNLNKIVIRAFKDFNGMDVLINYKSALEVYKRKQYEAINNEYSQRLLDIKVKALNQEERELKKYKRQRELIDKKIELL